MKKVAQLFLSFFLIGFLAVSCKKQNMETVETSQQNTVTDQNTNSVTPTNTITSQTTNTLITNVSKKWVFTQTPQTNWNTYQGHQENRTVFNGTEELKFDSAGNFYINNQYYGTWVLQVGQWVTMSNKSINIDMSSTNGYAAYGFNNNYMQFEILSITDSTMIVNHPYYKYMDNQYKLKVIP